MQVSDKPCRRHGPNPIRYPSGGCRDCVEANRARYKAKFTYEEWRRIQREYERQSYAKGGKTYQWRIDARNMRKTRNPSRFLFQEIKARARDEGILFNLTQEDVQIPETCPVFGIPLRFTRGARTHNTPSLDRIDPALGYTKGNVIVVSWRANAVKMASTPHELITVGRFYEALLSKKEPRAA
jgi:hypothetical protein